MKFDICLPNGMEGLLVPAPYAGPKEIAKFAREAERLGYHAVWGFDFINPTPLESIPDIETPNWYELMTTLAYVSAVTERLRLVAGVIVLPNREPVLLAKQAATVDQFSNGRLHLGIGLGGRGEFESIQPRERGAYRGDMVDEKLEALQLLLSHSNEPASYKGKYVEFQGVNLNPKPVQDPLPMFTAAETPAPLRRAAKWGLSPVVRDKDLVERKQAAAAAAGGVRQDVAGHGACGLGRHQHRADHQGGRRPIYEQQNGAIPQPGRREPGP